MIYQGDCLDIMPKLEAGSVQCVVTSPPYYGLRDYGVDGQIGLEDTPEAFVAKLVAAFQEVRRVLRDDGTVWLNLGDSYNGISGKTY
jgi:DNA modification methylase